MYELLFHNLLNAGTFAFAGGKNTQNRFKTARFSCTGLFPAQLEIARQYM